MKKILIKFLALVLTLSILTACTAGSNETGNEITNLNNMTIKLSHNQPLNSPKDLGAVAFKKSVEEQSNGKIKVDIYPSLQLGSMREQAEAVQMGSHELTLQPVSVLTSFVEELQIVDFPFLWPSDDKIFEVLDGEAGDKLLATTEPKGFKGLGFWGSGFKQFTTKGKEIHKPSDFQGVKMRVMPSPLLISQYKTWGASPTPIEYAELYNALQQKIVDGQENPIQSIAMNRFYEVQDNLIISNHGYLAYVLVANKNWFEGLPKEYKEIITAAEKEARIVERNAVADQEKSYLDEIKKSNIKVYSLTEEERKAFEETSKSIQNEFAKTEKMKELLQLINSNISK